MTSEIATSVQDEIRAYVLIQREVATVETQLQELTDIMRAAERRVIAAFEADPEQGALEYNGVRWSIDSKTAVTPVDGEQQGVIDWIVANGGEDLVQPAMHWKRRNSFLDEKLVDADGNASVPDELFGKVKVDTFPRLMKRKVS